MAQAVGDGMRARPRGRGGQEKPTEQVWDDLSNISTSSKRREVTDETALHMVNMTANWSPLHLVHHVLQVVTDAALLGDAHDDGCMRSAVGGVHVHLRKIGASKQHATVHRWPLAGNAALRLGGMRQTYQAGCIALQVYQHTVRSLVRRSSDTCPSQCQPQHIP